MLYDHVCFLKQDKILLKEQFLQNLLMIVFGNSVLANNQKSPFPVTWETQSVGI